jgi:hypothetical protein
VNCSVLPTVTVGAEGVTAIETSVAGVTVSVAKPVTLPEAALIVVAPVATLLARPPLAIVATFGAEEPQLAELVRFCVLPSEYVPVAVNCCCVPNAIEGAAGVTAIDTNTGAVTVNAVEPTILPEIAVIVAAPVVNALAKPCVPAPLLIVATAFLLEFHVTDCVML